jgi:hypothetical protein
LFLASDEQEEEGHAEPSLRTKTNEKRMTRTELGIYREEELK